MRLLLPVIVANLGLLLGIGGPARAADACVDLVPVVAAERDMQTHLRQARLFQRKGWTQDAVREVAMARSTAEGRQEPNVYTLSAQLAFEIDDIVGARCLARAAIDLQRSGEATEKARALLRELNRTFGFLTIYTSGDATTATFKVTPPKLFATAELKTYAERMVTDLARRHPLPVSVALPSGQYTINGQAITVLPGEAQDLTLHPRRTQPAWASPMLRLRTGGEFRPSQSHGPPPVVSSTDLSATWPLFRGRQASLYAGMRAGVLSGGRLSEQLRAPAGGDIGGMVSGVWVSDYSVEFHVDAALSRARIGGVGFHCPLDGAACTTGSGLAPTDRLFIRGDGLQWRAAAGMDVRGFGNWESLGLGLDLAFVRTTGTVQ
ncbi:MAG: hypothetical protein CL927_05465, partial [Deltaproteobacteria bacterium]|nr:hypothetical protein [Deltaproteobacteria bacterium]